MTNYQSNWVFNLILKLAVVICLSVLTLSLIIGIGPLTALLRSSVAFTTFAFLGWATSLVWDVPPLKENVQMTGAAKQSPEETQPLSKEPPKADNDDNHEAEAEA